jgi:hypothetical protein
MVTDNGDQNGHQVTPVCHCITSPVGHTPRVLMQGRKKTDSY